MQDIILQTSAAVLFVSIVFQHMARKNFTIATLYGIQSLAIVVLLLQAYFEHPSFAILFIAIITFAVKVMLAPWFFMRLIKRHQVRFTVSSYINAPLTLLVIALISAVVSPQLFNSLTTIVPSHQAYLSLTLSAILISLFLTVNRKGALSQIVGVLSLENSIVAFGIFAGLEQSTVLQFGITFDIFVWLIIATVFVSYIYRHTGSLDITAMRRLKD